MADIIQFPRTVSADKLPPDPAADIHLAEVKERLRKITDVVMKEVFVKLVNSNVSVNNTNFIARYSVLVESVVAILFHQYGIHHPLFEDVEHLVNKYMEEMKNGGMK